MGDGEDTIEQVRKILKFTKEDGTILDVLFSPNDVVEWISLQYVYPGYYQIVVHYGGPTELPFASGLLHDAEVLDNYALPMEYRILRLCLKKRKFFDIVVIKTTSNVANATIDFVTIFYNKPPTYEQRLAGLGPDSIKIESQHNILPLYSVEEDAKTQLPPWAWLTRVPSDLLQLPSIRHLYSHYVKPDDINNLLIMFNSARRAVFNHKLGMWELKSAGEPLGLSLQYQQYLSVPGWHDGSYFASRTVPTLADLITERVSRSVFMSSEEAEKLAGQSFQFMTLPEIQRIMKRQMARELHRPVPTPQDEETEESTDPTWQDPADPWEVFITKRDPRIMIYDEIPSPHSLKRNEDLATIESECFIGMDAASLQRAGDQFRTLQRQLREKNLNTTYKPVSEQRPPLYLHEPFGF
jgi:hypothetical protein